MKALFIILTGLLVLANAFFVIAEYALVRSRRGRLEALAEEGVRGARLALTQIDHIGDYISACQVGITMASIGIGALGEPALAHVFEPLFGGVLGHAAAVAVSVVLAYLLITVTQSIVGEIVPKLYTIQHAEGLARRIARPMQFFRMLFHPFIVVLNRSSYSILRMLGTDPDAEPEGGTPDELKRLIAQSSTGGQLDVGEANMLTGVFHLHEQEARQVMTPIPAVVTVDVSQTVEEALRTAVATGHSRLVVTEDENQDRVKGIVHVNQLVKLMMAEGNDAHFDRTVREAPIVPETKPLDDLLADLQRERTELAIVVDEYGRTAGIVTLEDIIEEVVGEISDETDPAGGAVRRLANGDWFVRGHVSVADLEDYGLELPVDTDAYNSVGGFVFAELGRLPKRGDTISADGYSIRVESVRQNRIEAVRIRQRRSAA
ncbi:MAG: HlyC/CorC family transporter [Solirubrobacterales bacterium]|nr:HlyC/CorC family transporter [Solirubrobacterales bacterium]MBV9367226.1 HlyC/CorC family transporter [Solirubrobacterales bacterium]MBV9681294.1 HlyC/CorC family transporter [Solirubrobacterales bacterium]MBV9807283.1 HlyC/CorC family transporter [Solirubrobacterales bacterium]